MKNVNLRIEFKKHKPLINNNSYKELKDILENELGISFQPKLKSPPPGTMGNELITALQALAVTINLLGLIWAIIVTKFRCSISIEILFEDGTKMNIEKKALSDRQMQEEVKKVQQEIENRIANKKVKEIIYRPEN